MKLINLTPHPLTLVDQDGTVLIDQAPDGPMARCTENRHSTAPVTVDGMEIPVSAVGFGDVVGLPAPRPGVLYVTSRATAESVPHRDDVVYPDLQVRDGQGQIIGCEALARVQR